MPLQSVIGHGSILKLIAQRIALGVLLLLAVSVLIFVGTEILPGDVASSILGQAATPQALEINRGLDYARNRERYALLRWAQQAFADFRVVPPGTGIVHQVNLEYLARGVHKSKDGVCYPDTLVGTDSHTTMVNGLGVLGWGVGGIEAEAAMLGQPVSMLTPRVVGFKLNGELPDPRQQEGT